MTRQRARKKSSSQAPSNPTETPTAFAAFVGIDWADRKHAVCVLANDRVQAQEIAHSPEAIESWVTQLLEKFPEQPVAVVLEQSQGGLIYALQQYPRLVLFPVNPASAAAYRKALASSGKKDDIFDAEILARFGREHHQRLRAWRPDDELTRELARHVELRRKVVEERKQAMQRITSMLKLYFPLALIIGEEYSEPLMLELLQRWPTLRDWQRANPVTFKRLVGRFLKNEERINELHRKVRAAKPLTTDPSIITPNQLYLTAQLALLPALTKAITEFDRKIQDIVNRHPDAKIFESPPGAGKALSPRLLVAFGADRSRFESAHEVECYSGIAPVTKQSGKARQVQRRYACNKFLRQTFHEFADHARKYSSWSKAFYDHKRAHGMRHHAAVRALAFKWIRILFRCWKENTTYDEAQYLERLHTKKVPYLAAMNAA